jgi:hypothetical protein
MLNGLRGRRDVELEHRSAPDGALAAADAVLATRIRSGDAEALGELFDRYAPAAVAAASALVADPAAAENIVHDAFVTAWRTIDQFDPALDTLAAWVLALTGQHADQRLPAVVGDVQPRATPS